METGRVTMMLSDDERRALADIEQALRDDDPLLSLMLRGPGATRPGATRRARPPRRPLWVAAAVLAVIVLATVTIIVPVLAVVA